MPMKYLVYRNPVGRLYQNEANYLIYIIQNHYTYKQAIGKGYNLGNKVIQIYLRHDKILHEFEGVFISEHESVEEAVKEQKTLNAMNEVHKI